MYPTKGKMVPRLESATERTANLNLIFSLFVDI